MNRSGIDLRTYAGVSASHVHAAMHQLVLPLAGSLELEIGGRGGRARGLQGGLIVAGERHAFQGVGENRFLVADLAVDEQAELAERLAKSGLHQPFFAVDPGLHHLCRYLEFELHGAGGRILQPHATLLLWSALLPRLGPSAPVAPARLIRALGWMRDNLSRRVTVAEAAAEAHLSASHLHALCRRWLGVGPQEYLAGLRLDLAQRLLGSTARSVAEIAATCGFSDQSALTRALRRERGCTPAQYRRRVRGGPEASGPAGRTSGTDAGPKVRTAGEDFGGFGNF